MAHFPFLLFYFILFNHNPFYFFTILFYLIQPQPILPFYYYILSYSTSQFFFYSILFYLIQPQPILLFYYFILYQWNDINFILIVLKLLISFKKSQTAGTSRGKVKIGIQASQGHHTMLPNAQKRDKIETRCHVRCAYWEGTDVLQEGLPGPRRTTHQLNKKVPVSINQCCGSKYIEFGSRILGQICIRLQGYGISFEGKN